ncbi:hypothetical protein ACTFIZ_002302 [Dictyostelium cf. discoideum]
MGKEISLFPSYDNVLTTDASESGAGATLKKGNKVIKTWSFNWSTTQSNMSSNRREMIVLLMAYQALWVVRYKNYQFCSNNFETMSQEESQLGWRSNQELQLANEEGSIQSHPTSIRSNTDGSIRISPEPLNDQLLNNQNECTPPRLESIETMSGVPTTNNFAFYPGEDELIQFDEALWVLSVRYYDGRIVWISGPYKGSVHDSNIIRNSGMLENLKPEEKFLAESAYCVISDNLLVPIEVN